MFEMGVWKGPGVRFVEFLAGCLRWDPAERFKPDDALQHEWITDGFAAAKFCIPTSEN